MVEIAVPQAKLFLLLLSGISCFLCLFCFDNITLCMLLDAIAIIQQTIAFETYDKLSLPVEIYVRRLLRQLQIESGVILGLHFAIVSTSCITVAKRSNFN
jgi:hypothetical protein